MQEGGSLARNASSVRCSGSCTRSEQYGALLKKALPKEPPLDEAARLLLPVVATVEALASHSDCGRNDRPSRCSL